ncbi:MAG: hypothetical protein Sylvanvirus5_13 [Sylvanvirus sp.]|uniref:ParB-like N-terminal domain-containing protein n=1 Tax=Sylvanvirus sp. TaxID=2487774 RepID=A0A3G5AHG1_9VIRU|nr:MAG: hypothetical protein Sylvanvirus5_13 [Sylvanvirus sp.]
MSSPPSLSNCSKLVLSHKSNVVSGIQEKHLLPYDGFDIASYQYEPQVIIKSYEDDGEWQRMIVKQIPLKDIEFKTWMSYRQTKNLAEIEQKGTVQPIEVEYNQTQNKYEILQGNHRCWAAQQLKYTHISAVMEERVTSPPPFSEKEMKQYRMDNAITWASKKVLVGYGIQVVMEDENKGTLILNGLDDDDFKIQIERNNLDELLFSSENIKGEFNDLKTLVTILEGK